MKKLIVMLAASIGILYLSGCNKVNEGDPDKNTGKLIVKITDDPFDISLVESATVTITKIEIRKEGSDEESSFIVLSENEFTMDLLTLRNGVAEKIVDLNIPQGSYDLIRLYVSEAELKIKDMPIPFNVKVPGGEQTGIKIRIEPSISVVGGLVSELLLDVDLSKSFVMRGNLKKPAKINGFIFKPVIRAANLTTSGRIEGTVKDTAMVNITNAKIWIEQDTLVASAFTDSNGFYAFIGVPGGRYSIYAYKETYDTVSFTGIDVNPGNRTVHNFILGED